jgi:RNA polymerase sigma-70 factor (ECF subfamily)
MDSHSTAVLAELVRGAQKGDRDAESRLLSALEPVVRAFFLKRLGRHADLDDLVQNTLLRVFRGVNEIKDGARVRGFALKAALFELQDLFRGRYGTKELVAGPDLPEQGGVLRDEALGIDIERALGELGEHTRQIMDLKVLGYRYEEIAEQLGTTEAAVKMQVKRALQRLKASLAIWLIWALPAASVLLSGALLRLLL